MTEPGRPRAARMSPDDRRRAIIDAVIPLLIEHGDAVTTKQVAEAAGIAEGTIFRVFPDKRALMCAAAAETMNPERGAGDLAAAVADVSDLRDKVQRTAEHLLARFERTMAVMIAVRGHLMAHHRDEPPRAGPPQFVLDAHNALHAQLTAVFAGHADALTVPPATAAIALRSLVFGSRQPGMDITALRADEIVDIVLHGITRGGDQ